MGLNMADPAAAQIAALAGYDWIMIDNEHNPLTEAQVQGLVHAVQGFDVQTIVRIRANREEHVKWVLDLGAGGVIVPALQSVDEVRHAVEICKYHPLGLRGYSPNRASGFWHFRQEYLDRANRDILLICMIEHVAAVRDIDAICQVEGVDALWLGPADLAQTLGHLGDPLHADVTAAVDKVIEAAERHGKPWGLPVGDVEQLDAYVRRGATVLVIGSDTRMVRKGADETMAAVRRLLESGDCAKGQQHA